MSHVRQQIREAVQAELIKQDVADGCVYTGWTIPLDSKLPAVTVYTNTESSSRDTSSALRRVIELEVHGFAEAVIDADGQSDVCDALDALAVAIEPHVTTANLCTYGVLRTTLTTTNHELDGDGDTPRGHIAMVYEIEYRTAVDDPETTA